MAKENFKREYGKYCLVFGITSNLAFALGTFLVGFLKHHRSWNGSVHVFHDGLSESAMDGVRRIWSEVSFQFVGAGDVRKRLSGTGKVKAAFDNTITRYSTMYFAKFEMFDLLQYYDKCIWFDVDMVVLRQFSEVWDFEDMAWRTVMKRTQAKHQDLRSKYSEILEAHPVSRPNAGLICASGRLRSEHGITAQSLYDTFLDIVSKKAIVTGDEMSLMIMAAKNKLRVKELSVLYNCPSASSAASRACVIHSIGGDKFWNDGAVSAAFPAWREYYAEWVASGGSEYSGPLDEDYIPIAPHEIVESSRRFKKRRAALLAMREFVPTVLCHDPYHSGVDVGFYFVKFRDNFRLSVASVLLGAASREGVVALSFEIRTPNSSKLQLVQASFERGDLQLPGFVVNVEQLPPGKMELANVRVPLGSLGKVVSNLHATAADISKILKAT